MNQRNLWMVMAVWFLFLIIVYETHIAQLKDRIVVLETTLERCCNEKNP